MSHKKILVSGLGGGLDVVNASLIYFTALNNGCEALLGSIRPAPQEKLFNYKKIDDCGSWVNANTKINYGRGIGIGRYCEPKISNYLNKQLLLFSRKYQEKNDPQRLRNALEKVKQINNIDSLFFVDGGGDSLTFMKQDAAGASENHHDPFAGGDSVSLQALQNLDNTYLAVISVGLDISQQKFQRNLDLLKNINAYFGRVNFRTGQKIQYRLQTELPMNKLSLDNYFAMCQEIVALKGEQNKAKSHTAVVTYNALKGNFGTHRTYVPWQPKDGVVVKPQHCWMYFFDASKIHSLKKQLNKKI